MVRKPSSSQSADPGNVVGPGGCLRRQSQRSRAHRRGDRRGRRRRRGFNGRQSRWRCCRRRSRRRRCWRSDHSWLLTRPAAAREQSLHRGDDGSSRSGASPTCDVARPRPPARSQLSQGRQRSRRRERRGLAGTRTSSAENGSLGRKLPVPDRNGRRRRSPIKERPAPAGGGAGLGPACVGRRVGARRG